MGNAIVPESDIIVQPTIFKPRRQEPCCWPMGDPRAKSFRECGDPAEAGRSYCLDHRVQAHIKIRSRTDTTADQPAA